MFVSSFGYKIIRIQKTSLLSNSSPCDTKYIYAAAQKCKFLSNKNLSKTLFGKLFYHDFFANSDKPLLYWVINLKFLSSQLHITWMWWLFWKCVRTHLHLSSLCISGFGCIRFLAVHICSVKESLTVNLIYGLFAKKPSWERFSDRLPSAVQQPLQKWAICVFANYFKPKWSMKRKSQRQISKRCLYFSGLR
jgi:hypothetical protein